MLQSRRSILTISFIVVVLSLTPIIQGKETGKQNSSSGCTCHYGGAGPTINHNFPSTYNPGQSYSIQLVASGGITGSYGGFSLDVNKGSYSNPGASVSFSGTSASHTNPNSRSWTLEWTAPPQGSGTVSVALAMLTANGNGANTGDAWSTTTHSITEAAPSNQAPTASNAQISSTTGTSTTAPVNEDLVLTYTYSDPDDDPEEDTHIQWKKNGDFEHVYEDMLTIPSSATNVGDIWLATVHPNDGTDFGTLVQTDSITIQDIDSDGDGTLDGEDAFPDDASETTDTDGDGVGDNTDAFPDDATETMDSDLDGVGDNSDVFPDDANETLDSDLDGVGNNADAFPYDATETMDSDLDGVGDNSDVFPDDANETLDSDLDGVGDNSDVFPYDATETMDSDLDGVGDNADALPNNANETLDTDLDGVGDNADVFPNDANETLDTDADGVGDNADALPNNANETLDTDLDGVGDNADAFPNDANETMDSDADGVGDNADAFPNDANETMDSDGDGIGDNAELEAASKGSDDSKSIFSPTVIILILGSLVLISVVVLLTMRNKTSNPLNMAEIPVQQLPTPNQMMSQTMTEPTVVNQWTDASGYTWRTMSDGSNHWWTGTEWQRR